MKNNYDIEMTNIIKSLDYRPTILLHSCCGPCSSAVIERLKEYFDITILYYNPNIEPKEEYEKRKAVQLKLLDKLNIKFLDSDYENDKYHEIMSEFQSDGEGSIRCSRCYEFRLNFCCLFAKEKGFNYFGTTLTVSPHKNSDIINKIGLELQEKHEIKFLVSDFKKQNGYLRSLELSKEYDLYRQDYCGCLNSMRKEK